MSNLSVRGEQSTSAEILALINLTSLATSGAGEFIRKTGATTFESAALSEIVSLSGLSDVSISSPSSGQVLVYNGSSWINSTEAGVGSVTSVSVTTVNGVSGTVATSTSTPAITITLGALTGVTSINGLVITANTGAITTGTWSATAIGVTKGGTGVTAISALSIWVANSANTIVEVTPGAGNSIRMNGAGTAWEAFTPSASVPTTITVANEATDVDSYIAFFTAATGDLGPKSNAGLTFNSATAILTATGFSGPLTGNVTGNVSGSSGSCTGNAATVTNGVYTTGAGSVYAVGSVGLAGGQTIAGSTLTLENLTLRANAADLTTGQVNVTSSKEATNTTTASVAIAGGLAVAKRVYALDMTVTNTITGSVSGTAATVTGAAQASITSLGTLTTLTVDDITINGNTISSAGASTLSITPTAGQSITFDGTVTLDAGVVAGMTSLTMSGNIIMAANSITMTGSIAATGARVTKGWFTDIESTNMPTVGGTAILTSLTAPQFTTIELGHATANTLSASGGVLSVEGVAVLTVAGGTLTGSITLGENTSIALDPAGSADGKYTGVTVTAIAGYIQTFGDLVYLDPTDSRWEKCDANSASGADGDSRGVIGIVVVAGGSDGAACTILLNGIVRADAAFPAFTINNPIYVSETAGAVTQTQPTTTDVVIRIVGSAITADEMYFNPDNSWITHT